MARLDNLEQVLGDFRDGMEAHLTSQVRDTRGPDAAAKLAPQIAELADNIAHAAALELVSASHKAAKLREDTKSRIDINVRKLDPKMSEDDETELDEIEEAVLKRLVIEAMRQSSKLKSER